MLVTVKTAVAFDLPREKALMEEFEERNPDWHLTLTTNTAVFKRTQIVGTNGRKDEEGQ